MPYVFEAKKIKLTEDEDSRRKIPTSEHDTIRSLYKNDVSINAIAKKYKVSRRLIQFILFPERAIAARGERTWKDYYDKDKNTEAIRKHRRKKAAQIAKRAAQ
jgi:predicted DNA-binding protein YlxM (UPF0122 family)